MLKAHSRPLTRVKFNPDGDLLASCAKDNQPMLWRVSNGERIGTYNGHVGTVFDCDFSLDSKLFLTGSADRSVILWDTETGVGLKKYDFTSGIRTVDFALGDKLFLAAQDQTFKQTPTVHIFRINDDVHESSTDPILSFPQSCRVNIAKWGPLNESIITAGEDGIVRIIDAETGQVQKTDRDWKENVGHKKEITDLQYNKDKSLIITASRDATAKVWDSRTLQLIKTLRADRPLNSSCFSPKYNQVILGGGQDAMEVTTTSAKSGHFETDFFHLVYEQFMGSVKGHFGPINTLAFNPQCTSFASGSEDGYVRLNPFPKKYKMQSAQNLG
jgi:translation initiation factor 3 subunit I